MSSVLQQQIEAKKRMEKEKEEAKNRSSSFEGFEEIPYMGLETGKEKAFRIIGEAINYEEPKKRKSTDPKLILQSEIVKSDKKKYVKINWDYIVKDGKYVPNPDFILTKLYNKVNEGKWVNYPNGEVDKNGKKGYFEKYHAHTQIYSILGYKQTGNAKVGEKFPKSFFPSKKVVMNVIDRHDSWCKDNNKTKVLTSKYEPYTFTNDKNESVTLHYVDTGIPFTAYEKIFEHAVKSTGTFDIDYVLIKKGKDSTDKYEVWDASDVKYLQNVKDIVLETPLTDIEKKYVLVDLDKYFPYQSSYSKIKKNLEYLFKLCDAELGTTFTEELNALVKVEEEERAKNKEQNNLSDMDVSEEQFSEKEEVKEEKVQEQPKQEETIPERRRPEETKSESSNVIDFEKTFPAWDKLTDEEKEIMRKSVVSVENGVPKYNDEGGKVYLCNDDKCKFVGTSTDTRYPQKVKTCPVCGKLD